METAQTPSGAATTPADTGSTPPVAKRSALTKVLPTDRLTRERQVAALRAFAAVFDSNGGKPVANEEAGEVVQPSKMAGGTIVTVNAFFTDIGLLTRQEGGKFTVAPEAVAFINAEHGLAPEAAPEKLRPVFEKQWFTQVLFPRLRLGPLDIQTVYKVLGEACNASKEYLPRIEVLVEFLDYVNIIKRDGNQVRLVMQPRNEPPAHDTKNHAPKDKTPDEDSDSTLEKHALTLDPKSKRRIVVYAPHTVTTKELERIKNWLSFQVIVEDNAT